MQSGGSTPGSTLSSLRDFEFLDYERVGLTSKASWRTVTRRRLRDNYRIAFWLL